MSKSKPKSKAILRKISETFGRKRKAPAPGRAPHAAPHTDKTSDAPATGPSIPAESVAVQASTVNELGQTGAVKTVKSVSFANTKDEAGAPADMEVEAVITFMISLF